MERIFMTGGTGFFGKSILDYRLRHRDVLSNTAITILSRNPAAFISAYPLLAKQPGINFVSGDIRSFSFPSKAPQFDTIVHAATSAVTTLDDREMFSTIVDGTRHILNFAHFCGARRLLFTSSGAVYGPQTAPVDENAPTNPTTAYGQGKLLAERMCIESGIISMITRCFAFTGPYLNRQIHYAIGNFIQDCIDGKSIIIKGDGTPIRSYMYADDLVRWLFEILHRGKDGRIYNVGSSHGLSIRELATVVRSTLGKDNPIIIKETSHQNHEPSTYVPITTRAETELGLTIQTGLSNAIKLSASAASAETCK